MLLKPQQVFAHCLKAEYCNFIIWKNKNIQKFLVLCFLLKFFFKGVKFLLLKSRNGKTAKPFFPSEQRLVPQ